MFGFRKSRLTHYMFQSVIPSIYPIIKESLGLSFMQIGGNVGRAIGPVAVALIVVPHGQGSIRWFSKNDIVPNIKE